MSRSKLTALAGATAVTLALLAAGCGGSSNKSAATTTTSAGSGASITAPASIKSAGTLVFCSDITYPPEESYKAGTTTPEGSDIDIGTDVARRMGVKARFDNTGFDGIIAALLAKKCDAVISGMNDTPERRKQAAFVDYLKVGQSFMVKSGNPEHITSIASLAGKAASVETGTTNKDYLDAQSKMLKDQGKKGIKVVTFPKDTDAANALKTDKVDAYFGDAPVAAYYIEKDPSAFAVGGTPVNPIPIGIAILKSNTELQSAVKQAVDAMYGDGTMHRILVKWKLAEVVQNLKP
ncbi:MAG: polar amino acid transport system substrate-binding protein [Gaiellaceae bacterium]|nr:polar amino acid transport system substrate-binding protein [Gaiellaceae bacterium]MDX6386717.1 polar amino acid transport system substrate-binding protein [Gaiellaceae bacterium]